mgnify:CR=1 FL=1
MLFSNSPKRIPFLYNIFVFWGFLGFLSVAFFEVQGSIDGYGKYARLYYGLSSALLIVGCVAYEKKHSLNPPWVAKTIGSSSYSIYLTHLLFNGLFFKLFSLIGIVSAMAYWASASIIIMLAIVLGCLTSHFIELPLTQFTRRLYIKK